MVHNNLIDTFLDILGADLRPLRLISILPLLLGGIGFIVLLKVPIGTSVHLDMQLLLNVMPAWAWAILFIGVASVRLAALLHPHHRYRFIKVSLPIVGLMLWVCMFSSNFIGNQDSIFALLYLVPAIIETWLLGRNLDEVGYKRE